MAEQQMANYTLTIEADSGYESTTQGRCTAEQYGQGMAALHGTFPAAQRPWQGLTDEDVNRESSVIDARLKLAFHAGMYVAQKILKERNT
jgi:hypothetical protein